MPRSKHSSQSILRMSLAESISSRLGLPRRITSRRITSFRILMQHVPSVIMMATNAAHSDGVALCATAFRACVAGT